MLKHEGTDISLRKRFHFLQIYTQKWIPASYGSSKFNFLRILHIVFHNGVSVYIPTSSAQAFPFLHSLTHYSAGQKSDMAKLSSHLKNHKNSASLNPELEAFGENLLLNSFFLLVKFSSLQLEDWVPNFLASCQQKLLLFPRCHLHSLTFYLVKLHISDGMSNPSTTSNLFLLGAPSPF